MRIALLARAGLGLLGLLRPRTAVRLYGGEPDARAVATARVLGGRHLLQATALVVRPTAATLLLSAAVDLLHGASMLAVAAASPRLRRPAATSACVALLLATDGTSTWVASTREPSTDPAARNAVHRPLATAGRARAERMSKSGR